MSDEIRKRFPEAVETDSGLHYVVHEEGSGDSPSKGQMVKAHYEGKFFGGSRDGQVFDSSVARNEPFQFPVGMGRVIKGWDEAFASMKRGEKRTIILPPHLAYGERGAGGVIPPNSTLLFDVELIDF